MPANEDPADRAIQSRFTNSVGYRNLRLVELEQIEELSDRMPRLGVVSHCRVAVDRVAVSSPDTLDRDEACLDEVRDDPLGRALRDADHQRDISCSHVLVAGDAEKDLG